MIQHKNDGDEGLNPEVNPVDTQRHLSVEERVRILEEADACARGETGAVL